MHAYEYVYVYTASLIVQAIMSESHALISCRWLRIC